MMANNAKPTVAAAGVTFYSYKPLCTYIKASAQ
jgi:hypothetical protein